MQQRVPDNAFRIIVQSALETVGIIFIDSNRNGPAFDFATRLDRSIFNSCRTARWSA